MFRRRMNLSGSIALSDISEPPCDEPPVAPARHDFRPGERVRVVKRGWAGEDEIAEVRGDHVGFGWRGASGEISGIAWFYAFEVERLDRGAVA